MTNPNRDDPIETARRAGYLDRFHGATRDDRPSWKPEFVAAWLEGWDVADSDARRSLASKTSACDAEVAGAIPAALPPA